MAECATCSGRGWLYRCPNDQHGDVCPDCVDPALVAGPPPRDHRGDRRNADERWYAGTKTGRKHHNGAGTGVHHSPGYQPARRRKRYYG